MSEKFNPRDIYRQAERQVRLKVRRFSKDRSVREDIRRNDGLPTVAPGQHLYYRMSMPFDKALENQVRLKEKIKESRVATSLKFRNYRKEEDCEKLMGLYNEIFLAAPDPSREITLEEVENFPEENTIIARLGSTMVGFTMLYVEEDFQNPGEIVGAIAGIGVLARYRGKRIGLALLNYIIDFFAEKGIKRLICEVYEKNEASLKMFKGLGMEIVGYMILEEEEGVNNT